MVPVHALDNSIMYARIQLAFISKKKMMRSLACQPRHVIVESSVNRFGCDKLRRREYHQERISSRQLSIVGLHQIRSFEAFGKGIEAA